MGRGPQRFLSNSLFWTLTVFLLVCFSFSFAVVTTPLNEDALEVVLREDTFKGLQIKNLSVKKKEFNFSKLRWTFELSAVVEKVWGVPLHISNLTLEGSKELFGKTHVKRAVMRFAEDSGVFKGGLILNKDAGGLIIWDLSNLDFNLGTIEKKSGVATFLNVEEASDTGFKAHIIFDGVRIPLEVSYFEDSLVFQIPKTKIITQKQKLPFKGLSQIPTSGEWTFASRVQMSGGTFTEASMLEVSDALVNVANIDTGFIRNGRGVGVLNLKMSSAEGLMNGKLEVDLEKSTFELNEGRFFKVDGAPFKISSELEQGAGDFEVMGEGNSRLVASIGKDKSVEIKLKDFDLAIVPNIEKFFGSHVRGFMTGVAEAELVSDKLGNHSLAMNSLRADSAEVVFETFNFPALSVQGNSEFSGSFAADKVRKKIDGKFDFTKAQLRYADVYEKVQGKELLVRLKAENVDNEWKTFTLKTSVDEQPVELKARESFVTFNFPATYKNSKGAIFSGSLTFPFCSESYCILKEPIAYDLKLSDYESDIPFLKDLKVSGSVSKAEDRYEMDNLVLRWPTGDQVTLSGSLDKFKQADLKVNGSFNYKNVALSNPFIFFKENPLQKAKLDLKLSLLTEDTEWNFSGLGQLESKKLNFEELLLSQNITTKYSGSAQLDLEPYLLRNEAATLTSTLNTEGGFSAFKGISFGGTYDANVVFGTSGLNSQELVSRMRFRASGYAEVEQLPVASLIKQGLESYAKEKQKSAANALAKCYPRKLKGKFDFDYNQGRWNLSPSAFQGVDKDSIVKFQGVLGDLSSVNLISHYIPGPSCNAELASCLGDAFPKGGMSFEITGAFKDPETDLDFAFIDQSLERCREIEAKREVASEANAPDTRDQKIRIQELKNFYNSRNLSR